MPLALKAGLYCLPGMYCNPPKAALIAGAAHLWKLAVEIAAKGGSPVVAVHTAQVAAAVVEDHRMQAWNAHLPSLLCTWDTSLVTALNPKVSEKSHGMLNATSTMCFTGLTIYAAHRGHDSAPGGLIIADPGWANSGGCCPGGPGIPGLCPGGPRG